MSSSSDQTCSTRSMTVSLTLPHLEHRPTNDVGERVLEPFEGLHAEDDGCRAQRLAGIPRRLREALRDRARPRLARGLHGGVVRAAGERARDRGRRHDREAPGRRCAEVVVERPARVPQRRERRLEDAVVLSVCPARPPPPRQPPDEVQDAVDRADSSCTRSRERAHLRTRRSGRTPRCGCPAARAASAASFARIAADDDDPGAGGEQGARCRAPCRTRAAGEDDHASRTDARSGLAQASERSDARRRLDHGAHLLLERLVEHRQRELVVQHRVGVALRQRRRARRPAARAPRPRPGAGVSVPRTSS